MTGRHSSRKREAVGSDGYSLLPTYMGRFSLESDSFLPGPLILVSNYASSTLPSVNRSTATGLKSGILRLRISLMIYIGYSRATSLVRGGGCISSQRSPDWMEIV